MMKHKHFFLLAGVLCCFAVLLLPNQLFSQDTEEPGGTYFYSQGKKVPVRIARDRVAIRLRVGVMPTRFKTRLKRNGKIRGEEKVVEFPHQRIVIVPLGKKVSSRDMGSELNTWQRDPDVEFAATVVYGERSNTPMVMTDKVVVKFKENTPGKKRQELYDKYMLEVVSTSKQRAGRVVLRVKPGSKKNALVISNTLYESGLVIFAHPDFIVRTEYRTLPNQPFFPNDTMFNNQWHLHNTGQGSGKVDADVDAPEAWDYTRGNRNVVIAVLDDGIQVNHADISPNIVPGGRDFTSNPPDNDPSPGAGENHGTCVTGVAAARGNNNSGVSGSCPRCGILPIRMLGGSVSDHADAFDYAAARGAWIITNSWGYAIGTPTTDDLVDAINDAAVNGRNGLGAVVLFAMTNTNTDNCTGSYPDISSLANVIAVSRSTNKDLLGGGGFGACMDLVAPTKGGTLGILTTDRTGAAGYDVTGDYYDNFGGTSSATPLVAGIAGLLLDLNPNLTRLQVQRILEHTAEKVDPTNASYNSDGFSSKVGYGRVNAHRAVVPTVKIFVSLKVVRVNKPFTVKVTASAPFGLKALWWFGKNTGITAIDKAHWKDVSGAKSVYTYVWNNVRISKKGTFTLGANARDVRYPTPGDGYPHQASEGSGIAYTTVKVVPTFGLVSLVLTFLLIVGAMVRKSFIK